MSMNFIRGAAGLAFILLLTAMGHAGEHPLLRKAQNFGRQDKPVQELAAREEYLRLHAGLTNDVSIDMVDLIEEYWNVGNLHRYLGHLDEARNTYLTAHDMLQRGAAGGCLEVSVRYTNRVLVCMADIINSSPLEDRVRLLDEVAPMRSNLFDTVGVTMNYRHGHEDWFMHMMNKRRYAKWALDHEEALVRVMQGDTNRAFALWQTALEEMKPHVPGTISWLNLKLYAVIRSDMALLLASQGRIDEAISVRSVALDLYPWYLRGLKTQGAFARITQERDLARRDGWSSERVEALRNDYRLCAASETPFFAIHANIHWAAIHIAGGQLEEAKRTATLAVEAAQSAPRPVWLVRALTLRARVEHAAGRADDAQQLLSEAATLAATLAECRQEINELESLQSLLKP